jgi:hypothetical protein
MNGWVIEWYGDDWRVEYRPGYGLLIVAEHNFQPTSISVHRGSMFEQVPWPWSHDTSPQPDEVIAELRRIAAEYIKDAK